MAEIGEISVKANINTTRMQKKLDKLAKSLKEVNEQIESLKNSRIEVEIIHKYNEKRFWEFWK